MRCPKCIYEKVGKVTTGTGKLDYLLACYACSWQVALRQLEAWIKRWKS